MATEISTNSSHSRVEDDVEVISEILSPSLNRTFAGYQATVWMIVKHRNNTPALDKYWYVAYIGGKKYQGYVYWTGNRQIETIVPSIRWYFQFFGYLSPA